MRAVGMMRSMVVDHHIMNSMNIRRCNFAQQRSIGFDQSSRNAAIQSFFQLLETNHGNLSSLVDKGPSSETIVSTDGVLQSHHLTRLFCHEATALHVKNFYHSHAAKLLGEELIQESIERTKQGSSSNWKISTSRGLESSDVGTLGEHTPYNVAVAQSAVDEYFEGVQRELQSRRRRRRRTSIQDNNSSDYYQLWPLDKLRLELEESWPSGAGLARETKQTGDNQQPRSFGGGLPRVMFGPTRWKRGFVHVDEMGPLNKDRGLFSANIYLTMPKEVEGGIKDAGRLSAQDPEVQHLLHKKLGKPNIIRPEPGDLHNGLDERLLIDC
eukprot:scaffold23368_cov71-Cyclotella_meneghiniana.AAC.3